MNLLTFTDFIPSTKTPAGKMAPARAKGSDGKVYALGRDVDSALILAAVADGFSLEVDTSSKENTVNGKKYTNHYLNSAKRVQPKPEPPIDEAMVGASRAVEKLTGRMTYSYNADDARQRLIVRQTALKAAVELVAANNALSSEEKPAVVAFLADKFVDWVFEEGAYDLAELNRLGNGSQGNEHGNATAAPQSPAHQHLAEARQKAVDRRADYSDEDAVCPRCGYREWLKQYAGGWFCARSKVAGEPGGCGYPDKGERLDSPVSYGEWKQRTGSVRRPDAPVVSPANYPSRSRED